MKSVSLLWIFLSFIFTTNVLMARDFAANLNDQFIENQENVLVWKSKLESMPDPELYLHHEAFVNFTHQGTFSCLQVALQDQASLIDLFFLVVSEDDFYQSSLTSPGSNLYQNWFSNYWNSDLLNQTFFGTIPWTYQELTQMNINLKDKNQFLNLLENFPPNDQTAILVDEGQLEDQVISFSNQNYQGFISVKGYYQSLTHDEIFDPSKVSLQFWYMLK